MRVLIVPNHENPRAAEAAREMVAWLRAKGHSPELLPDDAAACALDEHAVGRAELPAPDLVVALGGDGTILRAMHALPGEGAPILGINLGRVGFLSGADAGEMTEAVEAALAGRARVERRAVLTADVIVGGRSSGTHRALNEVFVGRGGAGRIVEVAVTVNGRELVRVLCDGVVVATPTGSTAYALSSGGPIVAPTVRGMVLTPVAPHTLQSRPFVLGPDDIVELSCPNPARAEACVVVDGEAVPCRQALERVTLRLGPEEVSLVRLDGHDFYDIVRSKFLGG